jgi:hypothetical protein
VRERAALQVRRPEFVPSRRLVGVRAETPACHGSRQRRVAKLELTMSLPRLVAVWDRDLAHATYGPLWSSSTSARSDPIESARDRGPRLEAPVVQRALSGASVLLDDVEARAAVEDVQAWPADQDVVAVATEQRVVPVAADEQVVACAAIQREHGRVGRNP